MRKDSQNLAVSVRQRLLNKARESGRPFQELLQYYAMERFLYRLSRSDLARKFILKGALMLPVWKAPLSRPTMDIDLLGYTENHVEHIVEITKEICVQGIKPDGVVYDAESTIGERITEDADYEGVRVKFKGSLDTARITMQLDVGFGDVVYPSAEKTKYPVILDFPAPRILGYTRESTIAEKMEAMVKLGILNSRMKDFFDIWLLSREFDFDGPTLATAIQKTFSTRMTDIPSRPTAFSEAFAKDTSKTAQWRGFIRRNRLMNVHLELGLVIADINFFLGPVFDSLASGKTFRKNWIAPGPWQDKKE